MKHQRCSAISLCSKNLLHSRKCTKGVDSRSKEAMIHTSSHRLSTSLDPQEMMEVRREFKRLEEIFGIKKPDDWYSFSATNIAEQKKKWVLSRNFGGSLYKALCTLYPDYPWLPFRFGNVPQGWWDSLSNQRQFFDHVAVALGLSSMEDWYKVKAAQFGEHGGSWLLAEYYSNSLPAALLTVYPDYDWQVWRFGYVPAGYWININNQKAFVEWYAKEVGITSMEDWYNVSVSHMREKGAVGLINSGNGPSSLMSLLHNVYPDYPWQIYKFKLNVSESSIEFHRKMFKSAAERHNFKSMEDWYKLKGSEFPELKSIIASNYRGDSVYILLRRFAMAHTQSTGSLVLALLKLYPEYPWQIWRFQIVPRGFWNREENVKDYLTWLMKELKIETLDDWYKVTKKDIAVLRGSSVLIKHGGLIGLLTKYFPQNTWKCSHSNSKTQNHIRTLLSELFPGVMINLNYKPPFMIFETSAKKMELDMYIPSLSLAVEYQGSQHYNFHQTWGAPDDKQVRDRLKREICKRNGITLITIPYWWDRTKESLQATIHKVRPDLLPPSKARPIPDSLPKALAFKHRTEASTIFFTNCS